MPTNSESIFEKFGNYYKAQVKTNTQTVNIPSIESKVSCDIVMEVFKNINLCVEGDRSKTKLNMLEKGIIKGMLSEKTLQGINKYIVDMYPEDSRSLMIDILKRIPPEIMFSFIPLDIMQRELQRQNLKIVRIDK